jgi:hypothetical protein
MRCIIHQVLLQRDNNGWNIVAQLWDMEGNTYPFASHVHPDMYDALEALTDAVVKMNEEDFVMAKPIKTIKSSDMVLPS